MTYCLGLYLEEGLVFLSDTRTNAGVDNVSTYCKMHHFHEDQERLIVLLSSGNLAVTQAVLHRVTSSNLRLNEEVEKSPKNLREVADLYQAAELVGDAVFLDEVTEKAAYFKAGLQDLIARHPNTFKSVRGKGLMMGLECAVPNMDFVNAGYDALILTVPAGDNVVRFVPALTITKEEIDEALARLSSAAQSLG